MKLLFVGCGHLGSALLQRWIEAGIATRVHIVKPSPPDEKFRRLSFISWSAKFEELGFNPDVVVLAVRPPSLDALLPSYAKFADSLFFSVIAGKSLAHIEKTLAAPAPIAIIRAMPNLPAMLGEGMTFAAANSRVDQFRRDQADALMRAIGDVLWMEDETHFDVATAISGCGPGYVFALTEAMARAGKQLGLSEADAMRLARQTVIGSAAYMKAMPESAAELRTAIGSPGTMTEAALKILRDKNGLDDVVLKAIAAATAQAKKLAQQS